MALARIRAADVFVDSKRVATLSDVTIRYSSGDESQIGADGYLGHSDGASTSTMSITRIVTVDGRDSQLVDALTKKKYVKMKGALIEGKIVDVEMRCVSAEWSSAKARGTHTGKFDFEGGPLTFTG
jgi:hypothetical protein